MDPLSASKTLTERSYTTLLDAICEGTLKPGERLTQDDVAKRLNVSRQPIISAFSMLRAQGFVRDAGRRGVMVAPIDEKLFRAIYQFRSALEPLAVMLATPNLTDRDVRRGQSIIAQGTRVASKNGGARALLQSELEFHSLIYELSGNELIGDTMKLNWHHLRRAMGEVLRLPNFAALVWREHASIFDAMVRGNAEAAAMLMKKHVVGAHVQAAPILAKRRGQDNPDSAY